MARCKRSSLIALLMLGVIGLVLAPSRGDAEGSKPLALTTRSDGTVTGVGGRYALVIGIDDYSAAGLGRLQYCEKDARAVRDCLVAYGGFPAANTTVLAGKQATLEHILHYLDNLHQASIFPQADTFVLYFSGHGGQIEADSRGPNAPASRDQYLIPANGTSDAVLAQRLNIPLGDVLRALDASVFKRKVLLLDACRVALKTDGAKAGQAIAAFDLSPYSAAQGVKGMVGALPGHLSWEDGALGDTELGYGHGVFSYYLLHGLYGGAADANRVVTFNGLDEYVATALAQYSREHPDKAQSPQSFGEGNGGIALTLVGPDARVPSVSPPTSWVLLILGLPAARQDDETVRLAEELIDEPRASATHGPVIAARELDRAALTAASATLSKSRARSKDDALADFLLSVVLTRLGNTEMEASRGADPSYKQHFEDAAAAAEDAVQVAPGWKYARAQLGLCYLNNHHQGGFDDALAQYQEAVKLDPTWTPGRFMLGWVYHFKDNNAQALVEWQEVQRLDPDYPGINFKIQMAQEELSRSGDE